MSIHILPPLHENWRREGEEGRRGRRGWLMPGPVWSKQPPPQSITLHLPTLVLSKWVNVGEMQGSLKDMAFSTKIKGTHHLQVAMFRCFSCIRIPGTWIVQQRLKTFKQVSEPQLVALVTGSAMGQSMSLSSESECIQSRVGFEAPGFVWNALDGIGLRVDSPLFCFKGTVLLFLGIDSLSIFFLQPSFFSKTGFVSPGFLRWFPEKKDPWKEWGSYP